MASRCGRQRTRCVRYAAASHTYCFPRVSRSTTKSDFKNPNLKASLTPYDPNALRNRLKVEFKDAAIPGIRFCKERNGHTYECATRARALGPLPFPLPVLRRAPSARLARGVVCRRRARAAR